MAAHELMTRIDRSQRRGVSRRVQLRCNDTVASRPVVIEQLSRCPISSDALRLLARRNTGFGQALGPNRRELILSNASSGAIPVDNADRRAFHSPRSAKALGEAVNEI